LQIKAEVLSRDDLREKFDHCLQARKFRYLESERSWSPG
jgi:hypothetical protein